MALRAYQPEKREIKFKGEHYADVRGLSFEDVTVLLREHLPDLEGLIELFRNEDAAAALDAENIPALVMPILTQAPGFIANVIALAADELQGAGTVMKWPLALQAAAVAVVWDLTFSEIGEVKKVLGIITALRAKVKTKATKTRNKKAR